MPKFDFSGLATAYEVPCQDGRVIKTGAFDHQAGERVPMIWRHGHSDPTNIVGHGLLSVNQQPPGMRVHARFNATTEGQRAKLLVMNGDVSSLSIWANELSERRLAHALEVNKGTIREFSLVLTGMNPGASIDEVVRHSDDPLDPDTIIVDGIIVHAGFDIELIEDEVVEEAEEEVAAFKEFAHEVNMAIEESTDFGPNVFADNEDNETLLDVMKTLNKEQKILFDVILHSAASGENPTPQDPGGETDLGPTFSEVFETLSEKQKNVLYYMAGELAEANQDHLSQEGETNPMPTHNIFEDDDDVMEATTLSKEQVQKILKSAVDTRASSLRDAFADAGIQDILQHSVTDIDNMFPDAQPVDAGGPQLWSRPVEWVELVLKACKTRPFARIKSQYADITGDDARAKGYVTAAEKVEEVIAVLKRVTTPQTIYKLQKLDRDDMVDITEFDVVTWLKGEMRLMLREELARAILISDGRANTGADAIITTNVRPIFNDSPVYTINKLYNDVGNLGPLADFTAAETVALIDYIAAARAEYRGTGSPTFYCQPEVLTKL